MKGRQAADKTLLVVSQVYVPDPAAVGQYMADAAAEMARRGWRVIVLTANRGYDDPLVKYPSGGIIDGVEVRRLPLSSFGKKSIPVRLLGGISFLVQVVVRGLFMRRVSRLLVSTSPPMCPAAALVIGAVRRVPIKYWVMDVNPDQMIVLGKIRATSLAARVFDAMNRIILARATGVITLDRFMAKRLIDKCPGVESKVEVIPPWPMEQRLEAIEHPNNPFRHKHGLDGKFVIMYSGNVSIASPVETVLEAALRLLDEPDLLFLFIGGGLGMRRVEEVIEQHRPTNIRSLPYQPLSQIKYSLPAADVHLVCMGDPIVGICHPSKVYNAMAVARPILFLGPTPCHLSDIVEKHRIGWRIPHGDVDQAVSVIRRVSQTDRDVLAAMGANARKVVENEYGKARVCGALCDLLEDGRPPVPARCQV